MIAPLRPRQLAKSGHSTAKSLRKPAGTCRSSQPTVSRKKLAPIPERAELRLLCERFQRFLDTPLSYIANQTFEQRDQAREIEADDVLGDADQAVRRARRVELPADAPAYFAALYEIPLLTPDLERRLFRKMNYLKWQAGRLLEKVSPRHPNARTLEKIDGLRQGAVLIRDRIISSNLRLVVSIARKFSEQGTGFSDLVSDGNLTLMYAVEKFDFGRGFRFSTYATLAIQRELARKVRRSPIDRLREAKDLADCADPIADDLEDDASCLLQAKRSHRLQQLIDEHLDAREQYVVAARFGLGQPEGPLALRAIGAKLGVSKERVRQLQLRAIETLRQAAKQQADLDEGLALADAQASFQNDLDIEVQGTSELVS